jgi:LacI family transcriptional regulator, galactose operon repressor
MADLAREAGVSVATVDRVLNRRAPVRQSTAERILKTAQALQYYASPLLRSHIQGLRAPARCAVLLQRRTTFFYQALASALRQAARSRPDIGADLVVEFVDAVNSTAMADRIRAISPLVDALAIVALDHPHISEAIAEARRRNVRTVALVSDLSSEEKYDYVGINNRSAGRTAGWFLARLARKAGPVGVVTGSHRYLCQESREAGFRSFFREQAPRFRIAETMVCLDDPEVAYDAVQEFISTHPDCVGIYTAGGGEAGTFRALKEHRAQRHIVCVCHELSNARDALISGVADIAIDQSPEILAERCLSALVASREAGAPRIRSEAVPFAVYTSENL